MDYNQNNGNQNGSDQWDRWNSNASSSSYYNQPVRNTGRGQGFTMASITCGILSITACCTGIMSLPLGALGILFAALVYRRGSQLNAPCIAGILFSCIGIATGLFMTVYSFLMLPTFLKNDAFHSQLDAMTEQMYGMDFEEFMETFYGYTFDD